MRQQNDFAVGVPLLEFRVGVSDPVQRVGRLDGAVRVPSATPTKFADGSLVFW